MNNKNLLINLLVFFLAIIIGLGAGFVFFNNSCPVALDCPDTNGSGYEDGWQAAKDRLIEYGIISGSEDKAPVMGMFGEVESKQGGSIIIKIRPLEPLADPDLDRRNISIIPSTELLSLTEKDEAVYKREVEEYSRALNGQFEVNVNELPSPPKNFNEDAIKVQDINVGDWIKVEASEDIRNSKNITAKSIVVQSR